jgi:hypothetical protein
MTAVDLQPPVRLWACPACPATDRTEKSEPHTQFHNCPANGGLGIPLVVISTPGETPDARHVPVLGANGAITSIRTERGDGSNDCTVFLGPIRTGQQRS